MPKVLKIIAMLALVSIVAYLQLRSLLAKPFPEGTLLSWLAAFGIVFALTGVLGLLLSRIAQRSRPR